MKKIVLLIAALAIFSVVVNAQDAFNKGTNLFKVSLGFNENGIPLAVGFERGIKNDMLGVEKLNLGIGVYFGYYGYKETVNMYGGNITTKYKIVAPGLTGFLHYQFIPKLDTYFGLSLGVSAFHGQVELSGGGGMSDSGVDFAWGAALGVRYEITSNLGAFIEAGKGTGKFNLGVAYKF